MARGIRESLLKERASEKKLGKPDEERKNSLSRETQEIQKGRSQSLENAVISGLV